MTDPYAILGVSRSASSDEIRAAYRKLAKSLHPDTRPGDKEAEERFKQVTSAFKLLSDPDKRAKFDRPSDGDIAAILDAWGVEGAEERRFLGLIAQKPWGLGGVANVLHEAQTLALGEASAMGLRHLRLAWGALNHFDGGA